MKVTKTLAARQKSNSRVSRELRLRANEIKRLLPVTLSPARQAMLRRVLKNTERRLTVLLKDGR